MSHVLYNKLEECEKIIENLEEKLDNDIDLLIIDIIWEKLSSKENRMNVRSNQKEEK